MAPVYHLPEMRTQDAHGPGWTPDAGSRQGGAGEAKGAGSQENG